MKVARANKTDLAEILNWLEIEHELPGASPFWKNRDRIRRAQTEGMLWVIRADGKAVAFQSGNYSQEIFNVKREFQRRGLGAALFNAWLKRAKRDNVNVLFGECEPHSSLPFWLKHGFELYGETDTFGPPRIRMIIPRDFVLPAHETHHRIAVEFFPEQALHGGMPYPAIARHELAGARAGEGTIRLAQRVIGNTIGVNLRGDLVIRITVDGIRRCYCKAKHDAARQAGVLRDRAGTFYIDAVNLSHHTSSGGSA